MLRLCLEHEQGSSVKHLIPADRRGVAEYQCGKGILCFVETRKDWPHLCRSILVPLFNDEDQLVPSLRIIHGLRSGDDLQCACAKKRREVGILIVSMLIPLQTSHGVGHLFVWKIPQARWYLGVTVGEVATPQAVQR